MDPEEKLSLLRTNFSKKEGLKLPQTISWQITSQSLQTNEALAKILPKFGDRAKEVLLNPLQKPVGEENSIPEEEGIPPHQVTHAA